MTDTLPTQRRIRPPLPSEVERSQPDETGHGEQTLGESSCLSAPPSATICSEKELVSQIEPEEILIADRLPPFPIPWRNPIRCIAWIIRTTFGLGSLILLLAVSAAVPFVNFWTFGYLLDVEGRVARSGKVRASFPLLGLAPRFGSILLGLWLCLLPLRFISTAAAQAELIDPNGSVAARWRLGNTIAIWLMIVHICCALARGGSLSCFARPVKNVRWLLARWKDRDYWNRASTAIGQFVSGLNVRGYYSQGWRGFLGTLAWLFVPSALYVSMTDVAKPGEVLVTLIGGGGLWLTLMWAPLLQARFAAENRIGTFLELRAARELFRRAPFAWLFAMVLTYLLALPLYLFKALSPPADAMWFVTIIFIVTIFPTKVALGWAYGRSMRQAQRAWWPWRWLAKVVLFALMAIYVAMLFLTPTIGAHGRRVIFEHHALLLPVPF